MNQKNVCANICANIMCYSPIHVFLYAAPVVYILMFFTTMAMVFIITYCSERYMSPPYWLPVPHEFLAM